MTWPALSAGYSLLCLAFSREQSEAQARAWYAILAPHFPDDESWHAAVREVAERERFFPVPAVFLERQRGERTAELRAEAGRIFAALEKGTGWSPACGRTISAVAVLEEHGEAVMSAFEACGGASTLLSDDATVLSIGRKRFEEVYLALQQRAPAEKLKELPAAPQRPVLVLPEAREQPRAIGTPSKEESKAALEAIERMRQMARRAER